MARRKTKRAAEPAATEPGESGILRDAKGRLVPGTASLHPGGRPKSKWLTKLLEKELLAAGEQDARRLVRSLIQEATTRKVGKATLRANPSAIREVFDRIEGRVPLAVQHSGEIGGALEGEALDRRVAELAAKLGYVRRK